jgi:hypothetical protein
MSLVWNCKTRTQPFVYVNTYFFFAGVDPSNTEIVLKLRTLLIGAIGHGGHRVTATDCATAGEWIVFCELPNYLL